MNHAPRRGWGAYRMNLCRCQLLVPEVQGLQKLSIESGSSVHVLGMIWQLGDSNPLQPVYLARA